jgi:hypothetical protein
MEFLKPGWQPDSLLQKNKKKNISLSQPFPPPPPGKLKLGTQQQSEPNDNLPEYDCHII